MKSYNYHMISMPAANTHVEFVVDDFSILRNVRLWSYRTLILDIGVDSDVDVLHCCVNYAVDCSKTTARHVNRFTTELFGDNKYFFFKHCKVGETYPLPGFMQAVNMFEHYVNVGKAIR
mgnify:CR=1 FL=1